MDTRAGSRVRLSGAQRAGIRVERGHFRLRPVMLCAEHVNSLSYHFGNFYASCLRSHSNLPADLKGGTETALRSK
jgi:hypothetical protein